MSELKTRRIHELKMEGDEGDILVAFAQLDAVDEDEDFTFAGAFKEKSVPMSAYQHNSWPERGGLLPPGKGLIREHEGWAIFEGKFFTDTTHGRDHYLTVKAMGTDQQWSYGYDVLSTAPVPHGIKAKRGLKEIDTHEVSPVLLGAQPTAHTISVKQLGGAEALDELAAEIAADTERFRGLKGLPRAGETFDVHISRMLAEVGDFEQRAKALTELRLKEGRAISTARLTQFEQHAQALLSAHKTFLEIIASAAPKPKEDNGAKLRRMRMEASLGAAGLDLRH